MIQKLHFSYRLSLYSMPSKRNFFHSNDRGNMKYLYLIVLIKVVVSLSFQFCDARATVPDNYFLVFINLIHKFELSPIPSFSVISSYLSVSESIDAISCPYNFCPEGHTNTDTHELNLLRSLFRYLLNPVCLIQVWKFQLSFGWPAGLHSMKTSYRDQAYSGNE